MRTMRDVMACYAIVAGHAFVRAGMRTRRLQHGQARDLARLLMDRQQINRASAYRAVRAALDVLGFGEPVRNRNHSGLVLPRQTGASNANQC